MGEKIVQGVKTCASTISHLRHVVFFFQAEDGIRDVAVTGVQRVLFRS